MTLLQYGAGGSTADPFRGASAGWETQLRAWWTKWPDANIGIACEASGLCVMDCDHGLTCYEDFVAWRDRNGLPPTYTVRSGRRFKEDGSPEFGAQMYYRGPLDSSKWELDGCSGDIKSLGGFVVAPPSIHPDSGEAYAVLEPLAIAPTPDVVKQLKKVVAQQTDAGGIDTDNRNDEMCSFIGKVRKQIANLNEPTCLDICRHRNEQYTKGPMPDEEVEKIVSGQFSRYPDVGPDPVVTIGKPEEKKVITDWREYYHTVKDHENVGPPSFLIEGFLPEQAIMGIGAFVGQKKTLAALNIVFSLCSGEPLFGRYKVTRKPSRVLYLGPENGLMSFSNRVNSIGLRDYLCKTFFYSTMSMQENRPLPALMPEEIQDAAIVIDTAIRFTDGSENDAAMMKEFAKHAFSLIRNKAACVIMLHHSPKSMTKANELTLENSFRGTGELSAFLSVALAMRTQDMDHEYESPSLMRFVKQRDFQPEPSSFEVTTSRETCRMTAVDGSDGATVKLGNTANKDGKDDAAVVMMKANLTLSNVKMAKVLKDAGIDRSKEWVRLQRLERGIGGLRVGSTL